MRLFPILWATAALTALPPIPPLTTSTWPAAAVAEPFARDVMRTVSPSSLAATLTSSPDLLPAILRNLGTAVMSADRRLRDDIDIYMTSVARALPAGIDTRTLTSVVVVDPLRYGEDGAFRLRINRLLPARLARLPKAKARAVIEELTRSAGLEFDVAESAAAAASLSPRSSASRRASIDGLRVPDDSAPIEASIYSLNRSFFSAAETKAFLAAVRAAAPGRKIIVLGEEEAYGRPFTPWPRDPFVVARSHDGSVVFVDRPDAQHGREDDRWMARAVIDALPQATFARWNARWATAPFFFHNGNALVTTDAVWTMAYDGFDAGAAARFYRRKIRFVHPASVTPLPAIDLDSIVTILPPTALVADIPLGIASARAADWSRVQREYPLRGTVDDYIAAQSAPRTLALQKFLDEIAGELQRDGFTVRRLPLLNIPTSFVARADVPQDKDFLITWNNVVLEGKCAVGFASLLPSVDAQVRETFAASGVDLVLLPPLTHSIVLGGGYRCASNHVRK